MTAQNVMPSAVQEILDEKPPVDTSVTEPADTSFRLAAGYLDENDQWHRDFVVRELTGRDEEALGKTTKVGQMMLEILRRGLVSVGPYSGEDVLDGLAAGDWETVLLAIRSVTFGKDLDYVQTCQQCRNEYSVTVELDKVPRRDLTEPGDLALRVTGRHGTDYRLTVVMGSTQRKLLSNMDLSIQEQNTLMLSDCLLRVDDMPSLGKETVLNMPMADRRQIIGALYTRKPGPRLQEVTTLCPSCGAENALPLSIAAMFQ